MMPPSLAWWASSLQLSGLPAAQAEVARQFLSRAPQLDYQLRLQMAYRIAGDIVSRIAPPPPPGAPPELVLAAVLAERHRRELARMRPQLPPMPPPGPWIVTLERSTERIAVISEKNASSVRSRS